MVRTKTKKQQEAPPAEPPAPSVPAPEVLAWQCYHRGKAGCGRVAFLFLLDRLPQPAELVDPKLYRDIHGAAVPEGDCVTCGACGTGEGDSGHQFVVDVMCGANPEENWIPFITREEEVVRRYKALALLSKRLEVIERELVA